MAPIRPSRVVLAQLGVLAGAALVAGAAAAMPWALMGAGAAGSGLFGLGLAGFAANVIVLAALLTMTGNLLFGRRDLAGD